MTRIVIEEPCEHSGLPAGAGHWYSDSTPNIRRWCPGGSRIVVDGIPDEWVETGAVGLMEELRRYFDIPDDEPSWAEPSERQLAASRAVLEAVLHDKGDKP